MDIKLNRDAPHGKIVGRLEEAPQVKFYQNGKYFDAAGNYVEYPAKPKVEEPKPEVPVVVEEPVVEPKPKKKAQLPPGLPTKE